jgi:cytochrome c1
VSRRPAYATVASFLLVQGCANPDETVPALAGADAGRGRAALERYECGACHEIPGVRGPSSLVGPPLDGFGRRVQLAGRFANRPEVLVRWIVDPPSLKADTAMPGVGVSESDARDMAAYLYTLE